jgi:hypothetical protein
MKKSISILFLSLTFSAAASTTFLCVSGFGMDADPIQANDQAINQANENLNASCTEGRLVNAHTTVRVTAPVVIPHVRRKPQRNVKIDQHFLKENIYV